MKDNATPDAATGNTAEDIGVPGAATSANIGSTSGTQDDEIAREIEQALVDSLARQGMYGGKTIDNSLMVPEGYINIKRLAEAALAIAKKHLRGL